MFIHRQCELLCRLSGLAYHSPNLPGSGLQARQLLTDRALWSARSGCIGPVRFFADVPHIEDYDILLHLRDPRDVLVSMFYSYCFIHPGEIAPNTGYRQEVALEGIDRFVLAKATDGDTRYRGDYGTGGHLEDLIGNVRQRYDDYVQHLLGKPNVVLLKYEEMVTDYRSWLQRFITPFPVAEKQRVVDDLVAQSVSFFPQRTQDVMSHARHITPGDYKAKLSPGTIERLDSIFSPVLARLGYEKHSATEHSAA
jgi:hypothetical protein